VFADWSFRLTSPEQAISSSSATKGNCFWIAALLNKANGISHQLVVHPQSHLVVVIRASDRRKDAWMLGAYLSRSSEAFGIL
jgi:hypothetical protein